MSAHGRQMREAPWRFYPEKVIAVKFTTFWIDFSWQSNASLRKKNNSSILIFANEIHTLSNTLLLAGFGLALRGPPTFSHFNQVNRMISQIEKLID